MKREPIQICKRLFANEYSLYKRFTRKIVRNRPEGGLLNKDFNILMRLKILNVGTQLNF